jgi:hypothetical protein
MERGRARTRPRRPRAIQYEISKRKVIRIARSGETDVSPPLPIEDKNKGSTASDTEEGSPCEEGDGKEKPSFTEAPVSETRRLPLEEETEFVGYEAGEENRSAEGNEEQPGRSTRAHEAECRERERDERDRLRHTTIVIVRVRSLAVRGFLL